MKLQKYFFTLIFALTFFSAQTMCSEPIDVSGQIKTFYEKIESGVARLIARNTYSRDTWLFYDQRPSRDGGFFLNNEAGKSFLLRIIRYIADGDADNIVSEVKKQLAKDKTDNPTFQWHACFSDAAIIWRAQEACKDFQKQAAEFVRLEKLQETYLKYMQEKAARAVATVSPPPAVIATPSASLSTPSASSSPPVPLSAAAQTGSPTLQHADLTQSVHGDRPVLPEVPVVNPQPDAPLLRVVENSDTPLLDQTSSSPAEAKKSSSDSHGGSRGDLDFRVSSNLPKDKPWHKKWQGVALIAGGSLIVASVCAFVAMAIVRKYREKEDAEQVSAA
jgi:hypothetical protein